MLAMVTLLQIQSKSISHDEVVGDSIWSAATHFLSWTQESHFHDSESRTTPQKFSLIIDIWLRLHIANEQYEKENLAFWLFPYVKIQIKNT